MAFIAPVNPSTSIGYRPATKRIIPLEVWTEIAIYLDGRDLFSILFCNRVPWGLFSDKVFWKRKIKQHHWNTSTKGLRATRELRHRYQHLQRANDNIAQHLSPKRFYEKIYEHTLDRLIIKKDLNLCLLFRINQDTGETDIYDLVGMELLHESLPVFSPVSTFGSEYCLGHEGSKFVLRRISDWSFVRIVGESESITSRWTSTSSFLIHMHEETGIITADNGTARVRGEHIGAAYGLVLPAGQFLTASCVDGTVKIWDLSTMMNPMEFIVPGLKEVFFEREVLFFWTIVGGREEFMYKKLGGSYLKALGSWPRIYPDYWVSFSDSTHVIGSSLPTENSSRACHFTILNLDGTNLGSFEHESASSIETFLELYVVTAAFASAIKIWSKAGECLVQMELGYWYPHIIDTQNGILTALSFCEGTVYEISEWDFGMEELSRKPIRLLD